MPKRNDLLADLLSQRDYWIVPSSPSGNSDHPDLKFLEIKKGINPLWMERQFADLEATMIAILQEQ